MKKILSIVLVLMLAVACGKAEPRLKLKGELVELPEWVITPDREDGIAAVGISQPSRGGMLFEIKKAELDAKGNIATKIQSEISRVTKQALREANVNNINDVETVFSQVTKEVVKDVPLTGVQRINIYKYKDGTLYVHMILKDADYSKYLANSQKMFEQRLQNANLARENLNKAQEATKSLFDELDKERESE